MVKCLLRGHEVNCDDGDEAEVDDIDVHVKHLQCTWYRNLFHGKP